MEWWSMLNEERQMSSEFHSSSGKLQVEQNTRASEIAVIVHLFYEDLFEEIRDHLGNLGNFDLYISIPLSKRGFSENIFASFPNARILFTANRGRDWFPFLLIYGSIRPLNYAYVLKIHTKKSPHMVRGSVWRADVYGKLLGTRENIDSVISALANDPMLGIIGPKEHVVDYRVKWRGNRKKTRELARRVGIATDSVSFDFVAGSMFWAKPDALGHLSNLSLRYEEFEPEPLGIDGSLVHALERFVGLAAREMGYKIWEVDEQGKVSEPLPAALRQTYTYGQRRRGLRLVEITRNAYRLLRLHGMRTLVEAAFSKLRELRP
jgi:lipopolysaccharide biosynthesis protein